MQITSDIYHIFSFVYVMTKLVIPKKQFFIIIRQVA